MAPDRQGEQDQRVERQSARECGVLRNYEPWHQGQREYDQAGPGPAGFARCAKRLVSGQLATLVQ